MNEDLTKVLKDEIDEEVLSRMPLWFRILRDNNRKKRSAKSSADIKKVIRI